MAISFPSVSIVSLRCTIPGGLSILQRRICVRKQYGAVAMVELGFVGEKQRYRSQQGDISHYHPNEESVIYGRSALSAPRCRGGCQAQWQLRIPRVPPDSTYPSSC
jgi:hypothetical protein